MIGNRHIPRIAKYGNVLFVFEKNEEDELVWAGEHPYYMVRCQKRVFLTPRKWLKIRYANIDDKSVCDDANAIHAWDRFTISLGTKTGIEITSVYLMSSTNSGEIYLILICQAYLKLCSSS